MKRLLVLLCSLLVITSLSARPFGSSVSGGGGGLAITTSSLSNAIVGTAYSGSLTCTGGSGNYAFNLVTASPNTDLWHWVDRAGNLHGTPEFNEIESNTYQCTDQSNGQFVQATLPLTVTVSGSLAITNPTSLGTCASNGFCAFHLFTTGGLPKNHWSSAALGPGNSNASMPWDGWLYLAPTSTGTVTVPVTVTDTNGTVLSQTETVTVNNTLVMGGIDPVDQVVHLPNAYVGSLYRAGPLLSWGGTCTCTFSSTNLPSWASISVANGSTYITGTPTIAGVVQPTIKVTDSTTANASATALINVSNSAQVSRPSYNPTTASGFFVKNGLIYDPTGFPFHMVGMDQTHYDAVGMGTNQNAALSGVNIDRVFMFVGPTAAAAVTNATTNYIPNNIVPMFTMAAWPITGACTTSNTAGGAGQTSTICFTEGMKFWVANESTLASLMDKMMINIVNEWAGPSDAGWAGAYQNVTMPVASSTGTTIHITSAAGSNPFTNSTTGYVQGSCGATNQVFNITGFAGTSGSYTITSDISTAATAGCNIVAGAVGIMRAVGYTCPLVIDGPGGQGFSDILTYAAQIQASDPLQNTIESAHLYGVADNTIVPISGMSSSGSTTIITLQSNLPNHPFDPVWPNAQSNSFYQVSGLNISGVTGTMSALNGTWPTNSHVGGTIGNWTLTVNQPSTGLTYGGGGIAVADSSPSSITYYNLIVSRLAALRSSNVATILGEFAVAGNHQGGGLTAFNGSINGSGVLTVSSMLTGSAPILPPGVGGAYYFTNGGTCPQSNETSLISQTSGTAGGAGVYQMDTNCASTSGIYWFVGWGPSPTTVLTSEMVSSAEANQEGWIPWSWDDHNESGASSFWYWFGFSPQPSGTGSCSTGNGCYTGLPSQLTAIAQDGFLNPRYGTLVKAQRAPYMH